MDPSEAMEFWRHHPTLEYLELTGSSESNRWFTNDISPDFLPNLRYLKADYDDVWILAPILQRLVGLAIDRSVNAQIPYLLRSILPDGLPSLKSLYMGQRPSMNGKIRKSEGTLWYETEDGNFRENTSQKAAIDVFGNFLHSIARGTPNLEELGMNQYLAKPVQFEALSLKLEPFTHLERLYFRSLQNDNHFIMGEQDTIYSSMEFIHWQNRANRSKS